MEINSLQKEIPYNNLEQVIKWIRFKIKESIPFAKNYIPNYITNPEELYYYLRGKVKFIPDPKGVELLQSMPAFIYDNYHGVPFGGDCDCMSITAAASLKAIGEPYKIVLCGNSNRPSHIFIKTGKHNFDLTRNEFNELPKYKNYWIL